MTVYILTQKSNDEIPRLVKNLGVFERRSTAFDFMANVFRQHIEPFRGGVFKFANSEDLPAEGEMGSNPVSLLIYENFNCKVFIERSELH